jgi:hypothetical protein
MKAMAVDPFDSDAAFPRLGEEVLAVLEAAGERRPLVAGEILFRWAKARSRCCCCISIWRGWTRPRLSNADVEIGASASTTG